MEPKKTQVRVESVNIKRKKVTGHSFNSYFKRLKEAATDGTSIENSAALHSRVNLDDSERCGRTGKLTPDTLLAEDGTDLLVTCDTYSKKNRPSAVLQEKESCNSTVAMIVNGSSASEKFTRKDESVESEEKINIIKRKCDKRMKRLILKQEQEIQSIHQVWEEEKLSLEKDHKLEAAIIRLMYSEGSRRAEKLRRLDGAFEKKMKEGKLKKDKELRNLEGKQLASRNVETQLASYLLTEARSNCYVEQAAASGELPLPSKSDKDVSTEVPEVVEHDDTEDLRNSCPDLLMDVDRRVESDETHTADSPGATKILDPSKKVPRNRCDSLPLPSKSDKDVLAEVPEVLDYDNAEDLRNSCPDLQMDMDRRVETDQIHTAGSPVAAKILDPSEKVSPGYCESFPLASKSDKDVSVEVPEVVDHNGTEDLRNAGSDLLMDVDRRVETDETHTAGSLAAAKILGPSEKVSPNYCDSLPQPVLEGQIHAVSGSKDAEGREAQVLESSLQTIAVISEPDGVASPVHSLLEKHTSKNCEHDAHVHKGIEKHTSENCEHDAYVHKGVEKRTSENCEHDADNREGVEKHSSESCENDANNNEALEKHSSENCEHGTDNHEDVEKHTSKNCEHDADNHEDGDPQVPEYGNLTIEVLDSAVEMVAPVQPHAEEQTIENCELLHLVSIDASRSANLSSDTDVNHQSHDSANTMIQTAQESSQAEVILGRQNDDIDLASGLVEQIPENLVSADRQDRDDLIQEDHGTVHIEAASSELVGHVAQPVKRCEQPHSATANVSPSCEPSLATEVEQQIHNSVRNSTEITEAVEDLSHVEESACQVELDLEMNTRLPDNVMLSSVSHDSTAELTTTFPSNMPTSQGVANTDTSNVNGSFSHQPSGPILFANPFENELLRIIQESQHLDQSNKDTISNLKSECEKEIQAAVASIRSKYDSRQKANEADCKLKKNELRKNQIKVYLNKVLAETFISTYTPEPSDVPGISQGTAAGSIQQAHQQSSQLPPRSSACWPPSNHYVSAPNLHGLQQPCQQSSQFPLRSSASQPSANHYVSAPNLHSPQQPHQQLSHFPPQPSACQPTPSHYVLLPNLHAPQQPLTLHLTSQVSGQTTAAPPVQASYPPAVTSRPSTSTSRPPVIHNFNPAVSHHMTGQIIHDRGLVPAHLQARAAMLTMSSRPPHMVPQPSRPPWLSPLVHQNHNRPTLLPRPTQPLPDISTRFSTIDSSYLETLSNLHAGISNNATASEVLLGNSNNAAAPDVLLIEDD